MSVVYEPMALLSSDELNNVRKSLEESRDVDSKIKFDEKGFVVLVTPATREPQPEKRKIQLIAGLVRSFPEKARVQRAIKAARIAHEAEEANVSKTPCIIAIIPTYETEAKIDKLVESLLLQSRRIDEIVVIINGPGNSVEALNRLKWLAIAFPGQLKVWWPEEINGKDTSGKSRGSKVGALNWAYRRFLASGKYEFMLGVDADVVANENMVHHLEEDLLRQARAGGVRAKYSFEVPPEEEMKGISRQLFYGQRREFTKKEIDDALQGNAAHILGGQATLFDINALREAASVTNGRVP